MEPKKETPLERYFRIQYIAEIIFPPIIYVFIQILVQGVGSLYYIRKYMEQMGNRVTVLQSQNLIAEAQAYVEANSLKLTGCSALIGCILFLWIYHREQEKKGSAALVQQMKAVRSYHIGYPALAAVFGSIGLNRLISLVPADTSAAAYEAMSETVFREPVAMQLVTVALLVPVVEELIYRGLLAHRMQRYFTTNQAIFLSALGFGLFHFNLLQGIYGFCLGIVFGYICFKYHNIIYSILMHSLANAMVVLVRRMSFSNVINEHLLLYLFFMILELGIAGYCGYRIYMEEATDV